MSIGYDSAKVPDVDRVEDLLKPEYKGKVALNGDPTQAGAAFNGVMMASLANGGSADDIQPGIDFFGELKKAGNFLPVDPTAATIESGQTPLVIDWDYLNAAETAKMPHLEGRRARRTRVVGGYYFQADQQGRPAPGGRAAVAGVPLLRRGPEPVPRRRGPPGPRRRHGEGRHDRQGRLRQAAPGHAARRSS